MKGGKNSLGRRSLELYRVACEVFPGGVNSPVRRFDPHPFFASKGKGAHLCSVDGRNFVDFCMAYGALILGHAPRGVISEVSEELAEGTLLGAPTEKEVRLAHLIGEAFPSIEMMRMVNSGTEATMHAIRLARAFTGKSRVVKFDGAFHGSHDSVLAKAGADYTAVPSSEGITQAVISDTIVIPFNDEGAVEKVLEKQSHEIAAFIVEPVLANAGLILPENQFLSRVRKLTRRHGVLCIFDEVITGFRLAFGGAQEYFDVAADITTLSKVVGGGFPLACYGGRREIMEMVAPSGKVYQAGTYCGNSISVAAGLATLTILQRSRHSFYTSLDRRTRSLASSIGQIARENHLNVQVQQIASMFQIYFSERTVQTYADALSTNAKEFKWLFMTLLENGVFIPPSNFESCFLSSAHRSDDIERAIDAYGVAFRELKRSKLG